MLYGSNDKQSTIWTRDDEGQISDLGISGIYEIITLGRIRIDCVGPYWPEDGDLTNVNLAVLSMDRNLKQKAQLTNTCFARPCDPKMQNRPTVLISHVEDEEGYKIDRITQNFIVHDFVVDGTRVDLFGSLYPEIYQNDTPVIRIFSTHEETGTIKEVCYYRDTMEPRTTYFNTDHPRYEKLAAYRKSLYVVCHNGSRFTHKIRLQGFVTVFVNPNYISRMNRNSDSRLTVEDVLSRHYGIPKDEIQCSVIDTCETVDELKTSIMSKLGDNSAKQYPKFYLLGYNYTITNEVREYIDDATGQKHHPKPKRTDDQNNDAGHRGARRYEKREEKPKHHDTYPKISEREKKAFDMIPYGALAEKPSKRRGKDRKRDYHRKYDF